MLFLSRPEGLLTMTFFSMEMMYMFIPRDQATAYSSCGKSRESSVLNVNPGFTLYTNNQCKVPLTIV